MREGLEDLCFKIIHKKNAYGITKVWYWYRCINGKI